MEQKDEGTAHTIGRKDVTPCPIGLINGQREEEQLTRFAGQM